MPSPEVIIVEAEGEKEIVVIDAVRVEKAPTLINTVQELCSNFFATFFEP